MNATQAALHQKLTLFLPKKKYNLYYLNLSTSDFRVPPSVPDKWSPFSSVRIAPVYPARDLRAATLRRSAPHWCAAVVAASFFSPPFRHRRCHFCCPPAPVAAARTPRPRANAKVRAKLLAEAKPRDPWLASLSLLPADDGAAVRSPPLQLLRCLQIPPRRSTLRSHRLPLPPSNTSFIPSKPPAFSPPLRFLSGAGGLRPGVVSMSLEFKIE
ncbi:uncharacterized protein LOC133923021 [Phragmites australis]|uniref:uncharacterized protein LOC133923021 n=1 Tax=Phragmites australis TaxID=29695 RepID=UPI002D7816C3|nr:uncharacterized protein LOC133923021 [Phragmites australis]